MKTPSKNVSKSLAGQSKSGRGTEEVSVSEMKRGVSMVVPGEGGVEAAPGTNRNQGGERSAQHYTEPMARFGGK